MEIDQSILDLVNGLNLPELAPEVQCDPGTVLIMCIDCKQMKELDEFSASNRRRNRSRYGKQDGCKACAKRYRKQYAKTPRGKAVARNSGLKFRYGIDHSTYEEMLAVQGGKCSICPSTKPGGRGNVFHFDHDHETGEVRGLLCLRCNRALGLLNDDPIAFLQAADYLIKHSNGKYGMTYDQREFALKQKIASLESQLTAARTQLETIVCTEPPDDGVILISDEATFHADPDTGVSTYNNVHFTPLGDALMELWRILNGS